MSTAAQFSNDVCRNRYDRIVFGTGVPSSIAGTAGAGASATCGDGAASRGRKWLLELGAMTVLEAELETLSVDGCPSPSSANRRNSSRTSSGDTREREWFKSCLETMLDGHYDALDGLENKLPSSLPSSRVEAVTATSTAPARLAAASISVSKDTVQRDAFRAVETSALLDALPGLATIEPPVTTATTGSSSSSSGGGGAAAGGTFWTDSKGDASAQTPSRGPGSFSGNNGTSSSSSSSGSSSNSNARQGVVPQQQRHHAPPPDDVTGGPFNPYAAKGPKRSNTDATSNNVNANTGAVATPFPPSSVHGAGGVPVQRFPDAGAEGGANSSAARWAAPSNGYPQQQQQQARSGSDTPRNGFGGPSSGPITSQHHPHRQPQQPPHQQRQYQQQQGTPHYGDRDTATPASRGVPAGGRGGRGHNPAAATADAWTARDPTPSRGGLFEAGSGAGAGAGARQGPGRHGQEHGQGYGGTGMAATTTATTGPFKTARELRATDIAPGSNRAGTGTVNSNGNSNGNSNDLGRRRGGEQHQSQHQHQHQQQSWDGQDSGRGGGRGAGGGMWGGSGSYSNQGHRGYGNSNGYGGGGGGGGGGNGGSYNTGNSRYPNNHDDDAPSSRAGAQGPPITPRLPNGTGLVRKRKFVPPGRLDNGNSSNNSKFPGSAALGGRGGGNQRGGGGGSAGGAGGNGGGGAGGGAGDDEEPLPEELAHLEKAMVDKIMQEVQQKGDPVTFDQIAGLEFAKKSVIELVCWPMERPDIFTGLRSLPKGLLLFGPPGTGKTLIGKAIAHQSGATFFSISASSLCSKWIGEGEKMVRTLFAVAGYHQPAVIFIDEVDSMLSMRSADENEASRRLKTEFLIQLDGAGTKAADRVLVVGATNRPQELDEAARRRFVKRLYVPLPDKSGRRQLMNILLKTSPSSLTAEDVEEIVDSTDGFSGADLHSLCTEAAMGPVRDLGSSICTIKVADVPPMETRHFTEARQSMRPSVGAEEIQHYLKWNEEFGSFKRS